MTENQAFWIVFAGTPRGSIDNRESQSDRFYTYEKAEKYFFDLRDKVEWVKRGEIYCYTNNQSMKVLEWTKS